MKNFFKMIVEKAIASSDNFSFQVTENNSIFIVNGSEMRRIQQQDIEEAEFIDLIESNLSITGEDGKAYYYHPRNGIDCKFSENVSITQSLIKHIDYCLKKHLSSVSDLDNFLLNVDPPVKDLCFLEHIMRDGFSRYASDKNLDFYIVSIGYAKSLGVNTDHLSGTLFKVTLDTSLDTSLDYINYINCKSIEDV